MYACRKNQKKIKFLRNLIYDFFLCNEISRRQFCNHLISLCNLELAPPLIYLTPRLNPASSLGTPLTYTLCVSTSYQFRSLCDSVKLNSGQCGQCVYIYFCLILNIILTNFIFTIFYNQNVKVF